MKRGTLLLLGALLLAAPAAGHVEEFSEAKTFELGPYTGFLDPTPAPLYPNQPITFNLYLSDPTGAPRTSGITPRLSFTQVDGSQLVVPFAPPADANGAWTANHTFPRAAFYPAQFILDNDGRPEGVELSFRVYPDLGFRIKPADAAFDPNADTNYDVRFLQVWQDAESAQTAAPLTDMSLRMERWTDDHGTLLGSEEVPLEPAGPGEWAYRGEFEDPGMYHLFFASQSGGFRHEELPMQHVYALPKPEGPPTVLDSYLTPLPLALTAAAVLLTIYWVYSMRRDRRAKED